MQKSLIIDALDDVLLDMQQPTVTDYQLFLLIHKLYEAGSHKGRKLNLRKKEVPFKRGKELIKELLVRGVLKIDPDFPSSVYRVREVADKAAEDICAIVNPFCYVSHLSAMQYYGLTNRLPAELCLTSPAISLWRIMRDNKIANDYSTHRPASIIPLKRIKLEKVRDRIIAEHETKALGETRTIRDSFARISTIGRTFFDMLDKSQLCGGMSHVLEVWDTHAPTYLDEIISEINKTDKKIVKARAGHILEERLAVKDGRIAKWLDATERGGSRVLDPEKPYADIYSEKWMISLNVR